MIGGWIKLEKSVETDPRFLRMCRALRNSDVTQMRITQELAVTLLVGSLARLWLYADTHIREDDTLDLGADEIDEFVGLKGFANLMPTDWLEIVNEHCVKLPGFQEHNGTEAKKRALTQKRVARHRIRNVTHERNGSEVDSNAGALPDQTRLDQIERRSSDSSPSRNSSPRKTQKSARVPEAFMPDREWALSEIPDLDVDREIQNFRDWEFKTPKSDWAATWRVWIRRCRSEGKYAKVNGSGRGSGLQTLNPH